jgi:hypothetical protein
VGIDVSQKLIEVRPRLRCGFHRPPARDKESLSVSSRPIVELFSGSSPVRFSAARPAGQCDELPRILTV